MNEQTESPVLPIHRKLLFILVDWAFFLVGLANLVIGTRAALNDSTGIAATSLAAGLILLFASTIERFESLKGLGIEAKTKQLDKKIIQADQALNGLRELTKITGAALIDLNCKMGRWDSAPSPRDLIEQAERVRQIMLSLNFDQNEIAKVLRPWAKTLCSDIGGINKSGVCGA
jgi:hypothetical protein